MFNGSYSNMLDAIAQGQTIDPVTGIITSMPTNIDGNWNASGDIIINWGFDNQQRFYLNNSISYNFSNSVDMMNTTGASALNTVKNHVVKDVLKFNMDVLPSRLTLTLKGDMQWHRACSDMSTFREINAWDFGAGITALAQLPLHMELETAMMQRSRRGYYDSHMNTDELVWNASLKRSFGSLLVAIEGYDILQQLSNRTYIINAQGRTETFTSVVPAFAMIKLTYSFK